VLNNTVRLLLANADILVANKDADNSYGTTSFLLALIRVFSMPIKFLLISCVIPLSYRYYFMKYFYSTQHNGALFVIENGR